MLVWVAICPGLATAQSMCVLDPVEVDQLEGAVRFEVDGESAGLPGVTVSISPDVGRDVLPVASFVTEGDGRFSIHDAAPGRYWLSFRHKALIGFSLELRVRPRSHRPTAFLIATIRNDLNRPCGGGSVQLSPVIDDACRSLEYQNENQIDNMLKLRRIQGTVVDMEFPPSPVPRTCMGLFTDSDRKLVTAVESDRYGAFAFGPVQPGRYRLVAEQPGLGVANVILQVVRWPSGGILSSRELVVKLGPSDFHTSSFVDFSR